MILLNRQRLLKWAFGSMSGYYNTLKWEVLGKKVGKFGWSECEYEIRITSTKNQMSYVETLYGYLHETPKYIIEDYITYDTHHVVWKLTPH